MFNVSISKSVLERIMNSARDTDNEVIGLLLGTVEKDIVIIEDSVSGEQEAGNMHASLSPSAIAKISDRILTGELGGRIVGWYHSHPGFGVFMSPTDISTQSNFQQFSDKVTAMVVDPIGDEFAFFFLDEEKEVAWLEKDQVHIFSEDEDKIPGPSVSSDDTGDDEEEGEDNPDKIHLNLNKRNDSLPKVAFLGALVIIMALISGGMIGGLLVQKSEPQAQEIKRVLVEILSKEDINNQMGQPIFRGIMVVSANFTMNQRSGTSSEVAFYLGRIGQGWEQLGHIASNGSYDYILSFDTLDYYDGIYQIKVNFTDSEGNLWEGLSKLFTIDNVPDVPEVRFLDPRTGDTVQGNITIYTEITDSENNIHDVRFYFGIENGNWTQINETGHDQLVYVASWDTEPLLNGTYQIKAVVEDSNLYIGEAVITVFVLNGG